MERTDEQIKVITTLFDQAEKRGFPLWLESGWAVDARLGEITWDHEDIDVAFPAEREADYLDLLRSFGFERYEKTDCGFLMWKDQVLLDSEPCHLAAGEYSFKGFPKGSCPGEKEGVIDGYRVRCVSWEAMYFEFLGYVDLVPRSRWQAKDFNSLRVIEAYVGKKRRQALRSLYERSKT